MEAVIKELVEKHLNGSDHFLVDVSIGGVEKRMKIAVFIDGDIGVNIEKCAEISRFLSGEIEERGLLEDAYVIDVSSPGLDKPLLHQRQFQKNLGRLVELVLFDGAKEKGKLNAFDENSISIENKNKKDISIQKIERSKIKSTKVIISF